MTDLAQNFDLGEIFEDNETDVVEYTETIVKGDLLKITGVNSAQQSKAAKQTTSTDARFIANHDGESGELHEALRRGTTKVTFGANVTVGKSGAPKANKILDTGTSGVGSNCCVIISDGVADDDTGLIYFDGAMS